MQEVRPREVQGESRESELLNRLIGHTIIGYITHPNI